MHSQARSLSSFVGTISLAIIAALLMAVTIVPAWAQNSVPPTAVQAAKMPRFASRLAHPVKRPGPPASPALARARMHRGPLQPNDIYDNGPINGNTDAWTINFGFVVSDTFTVPSGGATITGGSFGMWLFSGDTLNTAELSITSGENGGTSYFDQTVNFTQGTCTSNQYGYNVCTETTSFTGPTLNAGTYWVNLQNASVPSGDPVTGTRTAVHLRLRRTRWARFLRNRSPFSAAGRRPPRVPATTVVIGLVQVPNPAFMTSMSSVPVLDHRGWQSTQPGSSTAHLPTAAAMARVCCMTSHKEPAIGSSPLCTAFWEAATEAARAASSSAREELSSVQRREVSRHAATATPLAG